MYWYIKLKDYNGKDIRITPNFIDMKKHHNTILRKLTRIRNYTCSIPEVGRKRERRIRENTPQNNNDYS